LKKVFNNVIIIPGEKNYFLASDGPLDFNISSKISDMGIENEYINQYYIQDDLLEMRSETITESLIRPKHLNHDLKPLSYQQQVNYWLKYFKGKFWVPALLAMLFIIFIFYKLNILSKAMFVAGFSASGLEILIMFSLQVIFGNIYYLTGIVFVFFMLGLAIGAIYSERIIKSFRIKTLSINHMILIVFSLLFVSLIFAGTNIQGDIITYTLFALLTTILGAITGTEFFLVSKLVKGNYGSVSGNTYSSDLIGSAAGAFIITIYIVPWLGLILSAIFIGIMNLFVVLSLILYSKYHK
jgi:spermidine synthase